LTSQVRRLRLFLSLALALGAFTLLAGSGPSATADHIYDPYGLRGYLWFARYDDYAIAYVTSDRCSARETGAYDRIRNSTVGEFPVRWPSGIRLSQYTCDGVVTKYVDIKLDYDPNFATTHGDYGGQNHSTLAPSTFCAFWGAPYPCGSHPSTVHLNLSRFTSSSYSNAYRERLIMHETGHSLGLNHHCSSDAIMNSGLSDCNGGRWTSVMSYQETDRQGIRNVYPNWKYP